MSSDVFAQVPYGHCIPCVKGNPQQCWTIPFHPAFANTTHGVLMVKEPIVLDSPTSGPVHVNILNGSNGTRITFKLNSSDTIGKLKQELLNKQPEFGGNLVFNGKPVEAHQTLGELQVKHGATFITYQKCHGG
ncbi:hypothetical protein E1301_Tti012118 [Triplophysa tibetana]|uniref:Ubiquitin-like domain-containing protein n=1 Tax=Triplophysa tibetana TaxID=1572043 RepID=A0A5A9PI29_9TELE|nr:hypothetical protein E1301_Tti012118 [Triplophysa tibetana]